MLTIISVFQKLSIYSLLHYCGGGGWYIQKKKIIVSLNEYIMLNKVFLNIFITETLGPFVSQLNKTFNSRINALMSNYYIQTQFFIRTQITIKSRITIRSQITIWCGIIMMMIMNCFCGMVDQRKALNLVSSRGQCQRFLPS